MNVEADGSVEPTRDPTAETYARYSHQDQSPTSIDDQDERCRKFAVARHGAIPGHLEQDVAFSVKDTTAPNWDRVLDRVRAGKIKRCYVDEQARFARTLKDALYVQSIFRHYGAELWVVNLGINLADESSDLHLIFGGYKDQTATRDARFRVKRGMDGNMNRGLSNGDWCFGFWSVPLTNKEAAALGLPPRAPDKSPYKKLVINEEEAEVVRQIHKWFAIDKMSIAAIVRRLNDLKVPLGGKARTLVWRFNHVHKILTNRRYRGYRSRNNIRTVRNPDTGRLETRKQDLAERIETHDPALAIVDEQTWADTLRRFEEIHKVHPVGRKGWKPGSGSSRDYAPKHMFAGLLRCGLCGAKLTQTAGHQGGYYGCPNATAGLCKNNVTANRPVTEERLLEAIAPELREHLVVDMVFTLLQSEISTASAVSPEQAETLRKRIAAIDAELLRLSDALARGDSNTIDSAIREREQNRASLGLELREIEHRSNAPLVLPSYEWVEQTLDQDFAKLMAAAPRRAALVLRRMIPEITVHLAQLPWLRRQHLVARLTLDCAAASSAVANADGQRRLPDVSGFGCELEVPLRRIPFYEKYGEAVVRMRDIEEMTFAEIARILPGDRTAAAVRVAYRFGKHGTPDPDDRGWKGHCRRRDVRRNSNTEQAQPDDEHPGRQG